MISSRKLGLLVLALTWLSGCVSPTGDVSSLRRSFETAKPGDTLVIPPGNTTWTAPSRFR